MDILEMEYMESVNALEFMGVTGQRFMQNQVLTKQESQLQALKITILAVWTDTKDETPLCIRESWSYRHELTVHSGVVYWPTMNSGVKDFISNCTACNDYLQNNSKKPLTSYPTPSKPWS